MPRVPYVGVNDKAKKVKKMYIGVDGKARKVVKAYVGVNGIARIFYTADWWIPYGLKESNCIAAWQFYHAKNVNAAKNDITGNGHNLTPIRGTASSWTADKGFYIDASDPFYSDLMNSNISPVTGVFWYTDLPLASDATYDGGRWIHTEGNSADMAMRMGDISYSWNGAWIVEKGTKNHPCFCLSYSNGTNNDGYLRGYRGNSQLPSSGVVTFDRSYPQIFVNGNSIGVTYFDIGVEVVNNMPIGTKSGYSTLGGINGYVRAAAFFNCKLTTRQHSDLAKMITEIK